MAKKAIVLSTEDIDGNGTKDLSLNVGGSKIFTIYDAKALVLKIIGAAGGTTIGGFLLSLVGIIG